LFIINNLDSKKSLSCWQQIQEIEMLSLK